MYVDVVGTVEKPSFPAFQNFNQIVNWLNIMKSMSKNVICKK